MTISVWSMMLLAITAGCTAIDTNAGGGQAARDATTPGWTGRTQIIGSNSTLAGNAVATEQQQKWPLGQLR